MEISSTPQEDDAEILDSAILWRRISPEWWVADDQFPGQFRLSTAAFQNYTGTNTMSVGLADEMAGPDVLLAGHEGYGVAAFTAGFARNPCNQAVARVPEIGQPWHAHVIGKKSAGVKKRLLAASAVIVVPGTLG